MLDSEVDEARSDAAARAGHVRQLESAADVQLLAAQLSEVTGAYVVQGAALQTARRRLRVASEALGASQSDESGVTAAPSAASGSDAAPTASGPSLALLLASQGGEEEGSVVQQLASQQAVLEALHVRTAALSASLESRAAELDHLHRALRERDMELAERDDQLQQRDLELREKDRRLQEGDRELARRGLEGLARLRLSERLSEELAANEEQLATKGSEVSLLQHELGRKDALLREHVAARAEQGRALALLSQGAAQGQRGNASPQHAHAKGTQTAQKEQQTHGSPGGQPHRAWLGGSADAAEAAALRVQLAATKAELRRARALSESRDGASAATERLAGPSYEAVARLRAQLEALARQRKADALNEAEAAELRQLRGGRQEAAEAVEAAAELRAKLQTAQRRRVAAEALADDERTRAEEEDTRAEEERRRAEEERRRAEAALARREEEVGLLRREMRRLEVATAVAAAAADSVSVPGAVVAEGGRLETNAAATAATDAHNHLAAIRTIADAAFQTVNTTPPSPTPTPMGPATPVVSSPTPADSVASLALSLQETSLQGARSPQSSYADATAEMEAERAQLRAVIEAHDGLRRSQEGRLTTLGIPSAASSAASPAVRSSAASAPSAASSGSSLGSASGCSAASSNAASTAASHASSSAASTSAASSFAASPFAASSAASSANSAQPLSTPTKPTPTKPERDPVDSPATPVAAPVASAQAHSPPTPLPGPHAWDPPPLQRRAGAPKNEAQQQAAAARQQGARRPAGLQVAREEEKEWPSPALRKHPARAQPGRQPLEPKPTQQKQAQVNTPNLNCCAHN